MVELKCLACRKMNAAGDRFCVACGSSLDLKLCASCEAINNPVADNCHSCGKPLPAAEAPIISAPVVELSEAPFYAPRRFQPERVYDSRPSFVARLNRAAKVTTLVVLPVAAIGLWGWQFYGQKLLQTVSPWVKIPAAQVQTKVVPAAAAVVGPLPAVVVPETPKVKPAAAEAKRPPKAPVAKVNPAGQAPAAEPAKRAVGVTHTGAAAAAPAVAPATSTIADKPAVVETTTPTTTPTTAAATQAAMRSRVTHTRAAPATVPSETAQAVSAPAVEAPAPETPAAPAPVPTNTSATPAAPVGGTASCPQAAAVLGLCSPNIQKGGS